MVYEAFPCLLTVKTVLRLLEIYHLSMIGITRVSQKQFFHVKKIFLGFLGPVTCNKNLDQKPLCFTFYFEIPGYRL